MAGGAVRFSFAELCKSLMGAADYQAIAQRFDTLFLTGIPALSLQVSISPPHPCTASSSQHALLDMAPAARYVMC